MFRGFLIAAAVLGMMAAPLSAQSVKAGIEAWQRADYAGAIAIWRPLAEKGDADAAFNLGQAYRLGRGVPNNLPAAQTWFERAAQKGHVDAQATLGLLLFQNGNQPEGLKWLKAAAEQDEPRALLVYGTALFNGDSVSQNPILGYAYVSRAVAQGFAPAMDTLAQLDKLMPPEDRQKGAALAMNAKAPPLVFKPAEPARMAEANAPLKAAPTPTIMKSAPLPAIGGNWRIQLGAFSQRASAEALYKRLAGSSALDGRRPFYVAAGSVTRLQVGPFVSRTAAQATCNALKQSCFPVAAK